MFQIADRVSQALKNNIVALWSMAHIKHLPIITDHHNSISFHFFDRPLIDGFKLI
jgi:hypothetical protein